MWETHPSGWETCYLVKYRPVPLILHPSFVFPHVSVVGCMISVWPVYVTLLWRLSLASVQVFRMLMLKIPGGSWLYKHEREGDLPCLFYLRFVHFVSNFCWIEERRLCSLLQSKSQRNYQTAEKKRGEKTKWVNKQLNSLQIKIQKEYQSPTLFLSLINLSILSLLAPLF